MRFSSVIAAAALFVSTRAGGTCAETQVTGDAITGFRYFDSCDTWIWKSRDAGTMVNVEPDCQLNQVWPNERAVTSVCIRNKSGQNKCFGAPTDSEADQGFCELPAEFCDGIENMWGW